MAERRKDVRAVVRLEVEHRDARLHRVPLYISENISVGGMFLITRDPLPEGTEINLRFKLPGQKKEMQLIGRVLWVREESDKESDNPGMGIRFINVDSTALGIIAAFINEARDKES